MPQPSRRHCHVERGASAVEYALLVGFIAAVLIVVIGALGTAVTGLFQIDWPLP